MHAEQFGQRATLVLITGDHEAKRKALAKELEARLFEDGRGRGAEEATNEEELFEQIGRLKMEVEWLKKKAAELG